MINTHMLVSPVGRLRTLDRALGNLRSEVTGHVWVPAMDVAERRDSYVVLVELPGVNPAQVDLRRQSLSNWQCPTSLPRQRLAIRHSDGFRCGARSGWRSARTTSNRTCKALAARGLRRRYSGRLRYFGPAGGLWRWQRVATVGRIIQGLSDRHPRPGSASGCDSVPSQCTDRRGDSRCEGGGSTRFPRAGRLPRAFRIR